MDDEKLQVMECVVQKDFKNLQGRSVCMSSVRDGTKLGCLMHDLHCKCADEMYSEVLAKRVRELKETTKGAEHMSRVLDELYNEGREERKREMVLSMAEDGLSVERIARIVKENVSLVRQWISEGVIVTK